MTCSTVRCGRDVHVEMDVWPHKDRVRNDDIRDRVGVAPIEEKLVQHRLKSLVLESLNQRSWLFSFMHIIKHCP